MKRSAKAIACWTAALLLLAAGPVHAQYESNVSKVGTVAAPFLEIGVGARAIGMGGAFTAISDDVSGTYWNPAGTVWMEQGEVGFVHTEWLSEINFDNISAIMPLGPNMRIGGFLTMLSMAEMEVRTVERPEGTGELFRAADMALGLTFASKLTTRLSIGANAKYIRQSIWNMNASSVAADLGLLFHTPFRDLTIAMSVANFGPDMTMEGLDTRIRHDIDPDNPGNNGEIPAHLDTDSWSLPLRFRVGLALPVYEAVNHKLTGALDAVHPNDNYEYINLGAEWSFRDYVFLRSGWSHLLLADAEQGFTAGAGLRYRMAGNFVFVADFAYASYGRLDNVFRYNLSMRF